MAYKISFGKKALAELEEAYLWYNEISSETSAKFYAASLARLDEVAHHPHRFGPIRQRPRYRRAKVKRFPYLLIFRIDEAKQKIFILSIFHEKRDPSRLMKRLRK